jgi:hypothetical protein
LDNLTKAREQERNAAKKNLYGTLQVANIWRRVLIRKSLAVDEQLLPSPIGTIFLDPSEALEKSSGTEMNPEAFASTNLVETLQKKPHISKR